MQHSRAQTAYIENLATPFSLRKSETGYIDFKAQIKRLQAQINYLTGEQNLHELMLKPVMHYDLSYITGNIEYDLNLNFLNIGELTLRPGMNFQQALYDDSKHIKKYQEQFSRPEIDGLLKGEQELNTMSGNIRLDYKPISPLRFITSVRADKFNYPDKIYYSYQTATSYNFNSKHILRAVVSKANRSAFMGDTYANYKNFLEIHPIYGIPVYQVYAGFNQANNKFDYSLCNQSMIELGYRGILSNKLQLDLEFFSTITKDFSVMMPSYLVLPQQSGNPEILDVWDYRNLEAKSIQKGVSVSIMINPIEKLFIKVFGTVQETELKNLPFNLRTDTVYNTFAENTPTFYGGATVNYNFINRWNINTSVYFYSEQIYSRYRFNAINRSHTTMSTRVDANAILNFKLAYRISQNNTLYLNVRNMSSQRKTEFGYADNISPLYLVGANFSF
jgi:iron complex outermembrane receptor protein